MTTPASTLPGVVGVVGGGRMGSGIAHAFLIGGCTVRLVEASRETAAAARAAVERAVKASVDRGTATGTVDEICERLTLHESSAELGDAELAVEAVPEIPALKATVLGQISNAVPPSTVIATNTSSLSVDGLAAAVDNATRFLGLHFFNPVPASKLVEVVVGSETNDTVVAQAQSWIEAIGKTAVTVKDSPGFASSRLGVLLGLEAIRMVEEGVASPADIDAAMTLGYQHPVGPLRLTDLVGLDVRLGVAEYLTEELGPRFTPPKLMRDMVSRGDLGRKSGRGFFDWPAT